MIKIEGMAGKLEPKFHGRYKVNGIASGGNYILESALGNKLDKHYPITKLKPIIEDKDENSVEVEKILNKRKNPETDQIEYLVKWKGFDHDENEWVPTENFDELKIINEYNEKIHRDENVVHNSPVEPVVKRGRGRPRKSNLASALTILQIFLLIIGAYGKNTSNFTDRYLSEKFFFCDKGTNRPILTTGNCLIRSKFDEEFTELDTYISDPKVKQEYVNRFSSKHPKKIEENSETKGEKYETMMAVIHRLHHEVSGTAYECKFYEVKVILKTSLLGHKFTPIEHERTVKVSETDCLMYAASKVCGNLETICEQTMCKTLAPNFTNDYVWPLEIERKYKKCTYQQVQIEAEHPDDSVFRHGCKAEDGVCELYESTIVWLPERVIHDCPYEYIDNFPFERIEGNVVIGNSKPKLAFQITKRVKVCAKKSMDLYLTTSGLYLRNQVEKHSSFLINQSRTSMEEFTQFTTAENDYLKILQANKTASDQQKDCIEFMNLLELAKKTIYDDFLTIKDYRGKELILYFKDNMVYIPKCEGGYDIKLIEDENDICFRHMPIIWHKNMRKDSGFLTDDKVIIKQSSRVNCAKKNHIRIPLEKETNPLLSIYGKQGQIYRRKFKYNIEQILGQYEQVQLIDLTRPNMNHYHGVSKELKNKDKLSILSIKSNNFYYSESEEVKQVELRKKITGYFNKITEFWYSIGNMIKYVSISITLTVISTLIVYLCYRKKNNDLTRRINLIEGFLPTDNNNKRINYVGKSRRHSAESYELSEATKKFIHLSKQ